MSIPPEQRQQLLDRIEELLIEASEIIPKMEAHGRDDDARKAASRKIVPTSYGHAIEYRALVRKVIGHSNEADELITDIKRDKNRPWSLKYIIGNLRGIKDNFEHGFYEDLEQQMVANVSADFMGQAEALLKEGIVGQYDHVPAAVLCGAVLENRLRNWCENQSPLIITTKSSGGNKTLGPLIEELRKTNKFDKQVLRQLQWWADIRNHAAHGEFDGFDRNDVTLMLKGVDNFLVSRL